jgi:Uma2 family endonuclease
MLPQIGRSRLTELVGGHTPTVGSRPGYPDFSTTGPSLNQGRYTVTADMVAPAWMHSQITAEQYDSWSAEQCAGIEIVDGMVVVTPSASKRHNRLARMLANGLDLAAGPDWNADTDFDVRLQDVPLANRRPDVVVYRADTIDVTPTRPEHVLLLVEVVSPGSETTDRIVKADQYAKAGIAFYWRVEQAATGIPLVYTYVLDPASGSYRDSEVFTGVVKASVPFQVEIDLGTL